MAEKGADGQMQIRRVEYPDAWKGDRSQPYLERYTSYFPQEKEAAAAHGLI